MNLTKILLYTLIATLTGCAAIQTSVSKKNLDVQTKMSQSVFLDPVEDDSQKTVFIQVRNTSDKPDFDINQNLRLQMTARGFKVVDRIAGANFVLQANILQVGKSSPSAAEAAMYKGYGADGAIIGAGTAYVAGASAPAVFGAGVLGGLISVVADSAVKDIYYSAITDIKITKRAKTRSVYTTRVLSSANQVNLDFKDALPALKKNLASSIAGIFG